MTTEPRQSLRVASFFSGIGGFDLAFSQFGMDIVFQCEKNNFASRILQKHKAKYWPNAKYHKNISTLKATQIPESDIWCGGFPCQDLSTAGDKGKRKGLNGERSGLFYTFADLVKIKKPRWIVLENVTGLLNSQDGKDFGILLRTLDEFGYCVAWRVLDAKYFGTPQRRRRVFIIASLESDCASRVFFDDTGNSVVIEKSRSKKRGSTGRQETFERDRNTIEASTGKTNSYSIQHASIGRNHKAGPQGKGYRNDGETFTLDSRGHPDAVCAPTAPFRVRNVTGVPKGLDTTRSRFRALGNAVNVDVIKWIAQRLLMVEAEAVLNQVEQPESDIVSCQPVNSDNTDQLIKQDNLIEKYEFRNEISLEDTELRTNAKKSDNDSQKLNYSTNVIYK